MKLFVLAVLLCASAISSLPVGGPGEFGDKFEGDIILSAAQQEALFGDASARTGLINTRYRWTNNIVPYTLETMTDAQKNAIRASLDVMEEKLECIQFVERTNEADYVRVTTTDSGCYSYIGRIGGAQQLNLQSYTPGTGCFVNGTIMHEFIHALGFYHMQSATERDEFVTIVWENIVSGYENNFNTYANTVISQFGVQYDYGSVMHYPPVSFSVNGQPTIIPKDETAVLGQRVGMSDKDIARIRAMYCLA